MSNLTRWRRDVQDARHRLAELAALRFAPGGEGDPALTTRLQEAAAALASAEAALLQGLVADGAGRVAERTPASAAKMGPTTTGIAVEILRRMDWVPGSIAHLLDPARHALVRFTLTNARGGRVRLRVSSRVEGYTNTAIDTVELPEAKGASTTVDQLPVFLPEALGRLHEVTRASLVTTVEALGDGERAGFLELERSSAVLVMPRTTAVLAVPDPSDGSRIDLLPWLGAYVTPNAPPVHTLLRTAADLHPRRRMAGYQEDPNGVRAQVGAVFEALKREGLRYVNSVIALGDLTGAWAQRVRLPRESLAEQSANCLDGTVLMASVLEAASLHPALVLVPGHAFLAWETGRDTDTWAYVETTMIGSGSFEEAVAAATATAAAFGEGAGGLRRLPLRTLRADGVLPME